MTLTPEKYILKRRGVRRGFETGTINGLAGDSSESPLGLVNGVEWDTDANAQEWDTDANAPVLSVG